MLPSSPLSKRPPRLSFIYLTIFIDLAEELVLFCDIDATNASKQSKSNAQNTL